MDALRTPEILLACEGCGHQAKRSLGDDPDAFCHRCGDLMRIVDVLGRRPACEGRRHPSRRLVRR